MRYSEKPSAAERAEAARGACVPCAPLGDSERVPAASGVCQAASAAAVCGRVLVAGYVLAAEPQHGVAAGTCAGSQDPGDF